MAGGFMLAGCVGAANAKPSKSAAAAVLAEDPAYREFARELNREAGLSEADVLATLAKARVQQSILDAMSRPAEAKPWKDYRPIFLTDKRRDDGIAFYRANRELIERAAAEFGVAPEIIVAIIGVETSYGRNFGSYRVLDALVTLAFHYPPRSQFFRSELRQLFLLGDAHMAYPIDELVGSYAGAMGWGQFIPTSVANFARDYDGDGRIDLWNSLPDIIGSVANYFAVHGWKAGGPVAVMSSTAANARAISPDGLEPVYPVEQLQAWGYAPAAPVDAAELGTLLKLEGKEGREDWLTFHNFYVISRYNRSPLYSMAVFQLAGEIAAGVASDTP
ncbi:membrane-bound lytic murein transglycosylase B [Dokdonella immobilis]|uniref:Membrane-bound lytic murein transglycosylase B n=2 Tax=Dokdonella immobilis TaxID=578942 RepID=A0A1I5AK11_9GAMM|nr:membrane-bound lytic murein transglycosylase B [Dokdonella immobilis]